jgi:hypothetical protein
MSKRINVNPDHYKVAGRERPGNAVAKTPKQPAAMDETRVRWQRSRARAANSRPKASVKR